MLKISKITIVLIPEIPLAMLPQQGIIEEVWMAQDTTTKQKPDSQRTVRLMDNVW